MKDTFVSVIVPVYNAMRSIEICAQALARQEYPQYEVIFVDDGSTDGTQEYLKNFVVPHASFACVCVSSHGGPARARNAGIARARGEVFFFTDADVVVPPDWIQSMLACFADATIAVVGGATKAYQPTTCYERFEEYRALRLYGSVAGEREALPTSNLAVCRRVLDVAGVFDTDFVMPAGEDYELCLRMRRYGFRIMYEPAVVVRHMNVKHARDIFNRAYRYGWVERMWHNKCGYSFRKKIAYLIKNICFDFFYEVWSAPKEFKYAALCYAAGYTWGRVMSYARTLEKYKSIRPIYAAY